MITDKNQKEYKDKVIAAIIKMLSNKDLICTDLGDIGNIIGIAVGSITCDNQKDKNIESFAKDDFISGFRHGYSLKDGTH